MPLYLKLPLLPLLGVEALLKRLADALASEGFLPGGLPGARSKSRNEKTSSAWSGAKPA